MRFLWALAVFVFLFGQASFAQEASIRPVDAERDISVSALFQDLEGNVVWQYRPDSPKVLASNTKIFTTSAALLGLGSDFRWHTRVWRKGKELHIIGGGDPSLRLTSTGNHGERFLDELAASLKKKGLHSFARLILDDSYFRGPTRHPLWPEDQWQSVWCAPVSALSVNGNCIKVISKARKLLTEPPLGASLQLDSRDTGRGKGLSAWWQSDFSLAVRGDLRRDGEVDLAAREPREIFAHWVQEGLRKRGVIAPEFKWEKSEAPSTSAELIFDFPSGWSLAEALTVANKDSDNFVTEVLMRTLAAETGHEPNFIGGAQAVFNALKEAGWDSTPWSQLDGSGLARVKDSNGNEATPRQICSLLRFLLEQPTAPIFFDSLPIAGLEGRSKAWFQDPIFQPGRVHAKTGWIHGASALSGYLLADQNDILVFSILVNYVRDGKPRTHNNRFKKMRESAIREVLENWKRP
ncbi:MAG: D-alanyl-D-alanine carboxypeptidase/D-alanyl-D-alanine-endopeptidase [Planctomycetota bacterium]|nr:D-alanyl-D-alanine carboxypeptidase/D-alanyl-D-alanine-endopeptidase [Planctomycetota bacterium]